MTSTLWPWIIFTLFIVGLLVVDLGLLQRRAHVTTKTEALIWTLACVLLAATFNLGLYFTHGPERALEFLTGYLIEESLSIDNLFVFLVIFSYFGVPSAYQHRVLFWGILGALLMRGVFIAVGATLLQHFHWTIYLFGGFLVLTGLKMLRQETAVDLKDNVALRVLQRFLPITKEYDGQRFFVKRQGQWVATPLLVVLVTVESTDLIFAVDSIPAIFAVTTDPFIVYTSNVFALLGLRALYFVMAGVLDLICYLRYGLGVVLGFVGSKMLLADLYHIPASVSLLVVASVLACTVIISLLFPRTGTEVSSGIITRWVQQTLRPAWSLAGGQLGTAWWWLSTVGILAGMVLVSTFSVERGPRAQHAALTIHRAQLEVAAAREATVQDEHPALQKAETELALALIALTERRYDAAVTAAITARQWARAYLDRLAPSPSTRIPQPLAG